MRATLAALALAAAAPSWAANGLAAAEFVASAEAMIEMCSQRTPSKAALYASMRSRLGVSLPGRDYESLRQAPEQRRLMAIARADGAAAIGEHPEHAEQICSLLLAFPGGGQPLPRAR